MRYKLLGRSGLRVSELSLGTMTFGEAWGWGVTVSEAARIFDAYLDAGGNFVDTANLYTNGDAEQMLGRLVTQDRRNRVVLATKYGSATPGSSDPNASGNHRKNMVQALEGSLKRLNTDRIDILYVHSWDFTARPDAVMRALDDLVRQGKILHAGVSDAPAWVISRCNELADHRGWTPFVVNQIEYSLVERTPDRELLPMSAALDIGVVAWSPLAGGVLSGKYSRSSDSQQRRRMDATQYKPLDARTLAIAKAVDEVADEIGCSSAAMALAWVLAQGIIPIIGATRLDQLTQNLSALAVTLDERHRARLDAASAVALGFPHDFLRSAKGFVYGGMFEDIYRHREEGIGTGYGFKPGTAPGASDFQYTDVIATAASRQGLGTVSCEESQNAS